ncbi:MAG: hypothetical protein KAS30_05430, partial [Candidatus Diapherotrites archaeon]|nr:hypothetical protein [Candidatus Diapherotrites archaeon]
ELENSKNDLSDSQVTIGIQDSEESQNNEKDKSNKETQGFPFDLIASVAVILLLGVASYIIFMKFKRGN